MASSVTEFIMYLGVNRGVGGGGGGVNAQLCRNSNIDLCIFIGPIVKLLSFIKVVGSNLNRGLPIVGASHKSHLYNITNLY